jgi:hypothetical protein
MTGPNKTGTGSEPPIANPGENACREVPVPVLLGPLSRAHPSVGGKRLLGQGIVRSGAEALPLLGPCGQVRSGGRRGIQLHPYHKKASLSRNLFGKSAFPFLLRENRGGSAPFSAPSALPNPSTVAAENGACPPALRHPASCAAIKSIASGPGRWLRQRSSPDRTSGRGERLARNRRTGQDPRKPQAGRPSASLRRSPGGTVTRTHAAWPRRGGVRSSRRQHGTGS